MALDNETLKWASLVIFTMQNAAFVLLMRASKVYGSHYNSAVAVLVTEVLKFPLTCLLLCYEKSSVTEAASQLWKDIALQPMDTLKISIPALLYTVQNNALFIAVGHLEAAVFQVTYQLKTLTTAVLMVVILGKKVLPHQWFALLLLTAGAAMVQEPKKAAPTVQADGSSTASGLVLGLSATVVACVCSSVASVYLEKILTESKPSVWVRNAQLCIFTIPIAWAGTLFVEDKYVKEDGTPLHGFTPVVWAAIFTNAAGGMLVATVMKYAGNILRNFAQACAIVVGGLVQAPPRTDRYPQSTAHAGHSRAANCHLTSPPFSLSPRLPPFVPPPPPMRQGSWALFGFQITMPFVVGVFLVILSIFIYGSKPEQVQPAIQRIKSFVGLGSATDYDLVAQMEPLVPDEEAPQASAPPPGRGR